MRGDPGMAYECGTQGPSESTPGGPARSLETDRPSGARAVKGLILLAFMGVYCLLYFRGLDFGRPIRHHPDEWRLTTQAMLMVANRDFRPPYYYGYGTLGMYLQCPLCVLTHLYNTATGAYVDAHGRPIERTIGEIAANDTDRDQFNFFVAGRLSSALYAGVLVCLVYFLGKRLFMNRWIACLSALAVMVDPLMVQQGHFSVPNMLASMLGIGAVYCSVEFVRNEKKRFLYMGALAAGFAVGAKVTMVWALLPVLLAATIVLRRGAIRHIPLVVAVFVGGFILVEPCAVVDNKRFVADVLVETQKYQAGGFVDDTAMQSNLFGGQRMSALAARHRVLRPVCYWLHYGWAYFAATAVGLALLPFVSGRKGFVVLALPLVYLIFIGVQAVVFVRNYLPLVPFWALGLGQTLALVHRALESESVPIRRPRARGLIAVGICALLATVALFAPAKRGLAVVKQFTTTDPCQTALAWIEANVPEGARVTTEKMWIPPQIPFPGGKYDVTVHTHSFATKPYVHFLGQDYIVAPITGMADRLPWFKEAFFPKEDNPLNEFMKRNRELAERRLELVRHVTPEECGYVGVTELYVAHDVLIYKVPKVAPVRYLPKDFQSEGIPKKQARQASEPDEGFPLYGESVVRVQAQLEPGEYDLFVKARGVRRKGSDTPALMIQCATEPAGRVDVLFLSSEWHFASTIEAHGPGTKQVNVELAGARNGTLGVLLEELAFVPCGMGILP